MNDRAMLHRALAILHRMGTERTGWRAIFRRWYYADEPLRNDAANLVREAGFNMARPVETRLVGEDTRTLDIPSTRRPRCYYCGRSSMDECPSIRCSWKYGPPEGML